MDSYENILALKKLESPTYDQLKRIKEYDCSKRNEVATALSTGTKYAALGADLGLLVGMEIGSPILGTFAGAAFGTVRGMRMGIEKAERQCEAAKSDLKDALENKTSGRKSPPQIILPSVPIT